MLRIHAHDSSDAAKAYYQRSDYYSEGQELIGRWGGEGARRLGLSGTVAQHDFDLLCDNLNPRSFDPEKGSYQSLTGRTRDDRIAGWDFNYNAPKGVTLALERAHATGDTELAEGILQAFRDAMHGTMADIEAAMTTRVRKGGKDEDRVVGNLIYAEYVHRTARPAKEDNKPDPALHGHLFMPNAVYDPVENIWKAAHLEDIMRNRPRFSEEFHARLAKRMRELGFDIERRYVTDKKGRKKYAGWDVAGIPRELVEKFSRRQVEVQEKAKELGITDPDVIATLAATTRGAKAPQLSMEELRAYWFGRMTAQELAALDGVLGQARLRQGRGVDTRDREEMAYSILHNFQRAATLPERKLYVTALQHGMGWVTPEGLRREAVAQGVFTGRTKKGTLVATRAGLADEERVTAFARDTRGTCKPLGKPGQPLADEGLNDAQKAAVRQLLDSCDRVQVFKGKAGVGKSRSLKALVAGIEANGRQVVLVAPTAEASREILRKDGFDAADTLAKMLLDPQMQAQLQNGVLIIDEGGLVGTRTAAKVFGLARQYNARMIWVGDSGQNQAPEAGSALWLLEHMAGLTPAVLSDIQRQEDPRHKAAVEAFSEGRAEEGLRRLDAMGYVHEIAEDEERYRQLARDYVATLKQGKQVLAISPTHAEGGKAGDAIRAELRAQGLLGDKDRELPRWESLDLSEAERQDPIQYEPGQMVQFFQNARGGFKRGERVSVASRDDLGHVCVQTAAGEVKVLRLEEAAKFQVYGSRTLALAKHDRVRVNMNWKTADGRHRVSNGKLYTVQDFTRRGDPVLDNGWVVDKDAGVLSSGWVVTSHKSQGKTVKGWVFVAQGGASAGASSAEQAYVSASRATEGVRWYTDSKAKLLSAIAQSERGMTAMELVEAKQPPAWAALRERVMAHVLHLQRLAGMAWQAGRAERSMERRQAAERGLAYGR